MIEARGGLCATSEFWRACFASYIDTTLVESLVYCATATATAIFHCFQSSTSTVGKARIARGNRSNTARFRNGAILGTQSKCMVIACRSFCTTGKHRGTRITLDKGAAVVLLSTKCSTSTVGKTRITKGNGGCTIFRNNDAIFSTNSNIVVVAGTGFGTGGKRGITFIAFYEQAAFADGRSSIITTLPAILKHTRSGKGTGAVCDRWQFRPAKGLNTSDASFKDHVHGPDLSKDAGPQLFRQFVPGDFLCAKCLGNNQ
mmetsp:Transcript_56279/g.63707  ORF Transcript_56279/g.63707 Transcript_56279/m.63707 type:complete len:258 (-) Transcript_56279:159-932(-)